ncbi:hypothetical protein QTJ16_001460 [Diplocarpon rosae]|uniref:Uncharacterized protein n=1 Tax=Diplocarpon rosae TaxID=946125 RepID=A0AAD9T764_9HELO|nr:hypothetical protein QTJ16_001460 [Diplocarpon rosae]
MDDTELSTSAQTPSREAKPANLNKPKFTKATERDEAARRERMTAEEIFDEDGFCVDEEASSTPFIQKGVSMVGTADLRTPRPVGSIPPNSGPRPPSQNPRGHRATQSRGTNRVQGRGRAARGIAGIGPRGLRRGSPSRNVQDERRFPDAPLFAGPPQGYSSVHHLSHPANPQGFYDYASNAYPAGPPGFPPNWRETLWVLRPAPSSHHRLLSSRSFGPPGAHPGQPVAPRSIRKPATFQHGLPSHLAAGSMISSTPTVPVDSLGWLGPPSNLRNNPPTSSAGPVRARQTMAAYLENIRPEGMASESAHSQGFQQPQARLRTLVDACRNDGTTAVRNHALQWEQRSRSSMPSLAWQHGSTAPSIVATRPSRAVEEVAQRTPPAGPSTLPATGNSRPAQDTVRYHLPSLQSQHTPPWSAPSQHFESAELPRFVTQPSRMLNSGLVMQVPFKSMKVENTSSFFPGSGPAESRLRSAENARKSGVKPSSTFVETTSRRAGEAFAGGRRSAVTQDVNDSDSDSEEPYLSPSVKLGPGGESPPSRRTARPAGPSSGIDPDIALSPRIHATPPHPPYSHYVDTQVLETQARPWLTVVRELHDLSYYFGTLISDYNITSKSINCKDFQTRWRAVIGKSRPLLSFKIVPSSASAGMAQKKALALSHSLWGARTDLRRHASRHNLDIFRQLIDEILTEVLRDAPPEPRSR